MHPYFTSELQHFSMYGCMRERMDTLQHLLLQQLDGRLDRRVPGLPLGAHLCDRCAYISLCIHTSGQDMVLMIISLLSELSAESQSDTDPARTPSRRATRCVSMHAPVHGLKFAIPRQRIQSLLELFEPKSPAGGQEITSEGIQMDGHKFLTKQRYTVYHAVCTCTFSDVHSLMDSLRWTVSDDC